MAKRKIKRKKTKIKRKKTAIQVYEYTPNQLAIVSSPTPDVAVFQRPGRGMDEETGERKTFSYVKLGYVINRLNQMFGPVGWDHEVEVVPQLTDANFITVMVKLTAKDRQGHTVTKTAAGGSERKFIRGTKDYVDPGDDLKAAIADGLKKAASYFGIAFDIYYPDVYRLQKAMVEAKIEKPEATFVKADEPKFWCERHGKSNRPKSISKQAAEYSKQRFGHHLCDECQKWAEAKIAEKNAVQSYGKILRSVRESTDAAGLKKLFARIKTDKNLTDQEKSYVQIAIRDRLEELAKAKNHGRK